METIQKFIPVEGQGPFGERQRIQIEIPKSAGVIDLASASLIGKIQITSSTNGVANTQADWRLKDGVIDCIRDSRVMTGSGRVLDELQGVNILAAAKNAFAKNDSSRAGRRLVELADAPLLTKSKTTGTDSSYDQFKFTMPLQSTSLGAFAIDEFPAFKDGLKCEFLLDENTVAVQENLINRGYTCEDFAGAAQTFVQLSEAVRGEPFQVGDRVVVSWAGPLDYEDVEIASVDYSGKFPRIEFTSSPGNAGTESGVVIQRRDLTPESPAVSSTTMDFVGSSATSPLYVGMSMRVLYNDGGTPRSADVKVTELDTAGASAGNYRITFAPALTGGAFETPEIRTIPSSAPVWQISDLSLELATMPPDEKMAKASSMEFPVVSCVNIREMVQPALYNELTLPSSDFMMAARSIMSIPIDMSKPYSDYRLKGLRDDFIRYAYLVDGQSDPLQPIDVSRAVSPYHFSTLAEAFSQIGVEVKRIDSDSFSFAKPLSALGAASNLMGKRVALRFERSDLDDAVALMFNHFVFANRVITL